METYYLKIMFTLLNNTKCKSDHMKCKIVIRKVGI